MEVILLEPVKKLGNSGEKVTVKNGFARNYLIPRGVALRASKENLAVYESRKAEIEKANAGKKSAAEASAKKLDGAKITILRQAAEDGRLYGAVSVKEIADGLAAKGFDVDSKVVELINQIKAVGIYKVRLALYVGVDVEVTVNVARTESEADNQTAAELKAAEEAQKAEKVEKTEKAEKQSA